MRFDAKYLPYMLQGLQRYPHNFQTNDWIYDQRHWAQSLERRWKGPFLVLLTTPTALKVDGIVAWVHTSHVKPAEALFPRGHCWTVQKRDNLLKLKSLIMTVWWYL